MCFKMKMPQVQMPKVETTGKDLLPEAKSAEPEAPLMGDEDSPTSFVDIAKKKGVGSLQIKTPQVKDYNPTYNYFNKR